MSKLLPYPLKIKWEDRYQNKGRYQIKSFKDLEHLQENTHIYKKLIVEKVGDYSSVVEMLEANDFDMELLDEDLFVGHGIEAEVYRINNHPNKVLRVILNVSKDPEFEGSARKYIDKMNELVDNKFDHVVNVYFNVYVKKYDVVVSLMEELESINLTELEKNAIMYRSYSSFQEEYLRGDEYNVDFFIQNKDEFFDLYKAHLGTIHEDPSDYKFSKKVQNIIYDMLLGYKELLNIGIVMKDLHVGNVMKDSKSGRYKLIDVIFFI